MRHVDDGTIHAWLDEQVTDPTEAAWIDEHLRGCGECRVRVAEERATFDRAQTLLAGTTPSGERPVFEALAAKAVGNPKGSGMASGVEPSGSRTRRWLVPLAWAASFALAVGLGWTARDLTNGEPDRPVAGTEQARATATVPGQRLEISSPSPEPQAAPPPAAAAPQRRSDLSQPKPALESAPRPPAADTASAVAPLAAVPVRVATATAATAPPAAPPPSAASVRQETSAGIAAPSPIAGAAVYAAWSPPLPRTEAAVRAGMPLYGIDGLEPQYTALSADGTLVRTLYQLASGDLVELLQQRSGAANSASLADVQATARSLAPGRGAVVAERGATGPRTWSSVRGGVRVTLQTNSTAADLDALGIKLRVD